MLDLQRKAVHVKQVAFTEQTEGLYTLNTSLRSIPHVFPDFDFVVFSCRHTDEVLLRLSVRLKLFSTFVQLLSTHCFSFLLSIMQYCLKLKLGGN